MENSGDNAWILESSALVFMMLPGIALFYSGLRSQSTVLSLLWINMMAFSLVTVQWFLIGYTLVFSPNSSSQFLGNLYNACFRNTMSEDSFAGIREGDTPAIAFGLFQGMFAAFTIALVTGVIAERGRLFPFLVFTLFWTTLGYDPVAYWMWNSNGWGNRLGALDWAGGTPVHRAASLAYTLTLKQIRKNTSDTSSFDDSVSADHEAAASSARKSRVKEGPRNVERRLVSHNLPMAFLGLMLVWFGWFGFNAGSELKANRRAASTFVATHLAAASGGFAYCLYEKWQDDWSGIGFCTGAFAGLVAITPGAGYVPMWAAIVFGTTASLICFIIVSLKTPSRWLEEPLDICVVHGVGGIWGMLLTGIFADKATAALDGSVIDGGAINGHPIQIVYQLAGGLAGFGYSFTVALLILIVIHLLSKISFFSGLALRAKPRIAAEAEYMRLDDVEQGDRHPYRTYCALNDQDQEVEPATSGSQAPAVVSHNHNPDPIPDQAASSALGKGLMTEQISTEPHDDWQSNKVGDSIHLKPWLLGKIDPYQSLSNGEYMGMEQGGGTRGDNGGEGSSSRPDRPFETFQPFIETSSKVRGDATTSSSKPLMPGAPFVGYESSHYR